MTKYLLSNDGCLPASKTVSSVFNQTNSFNWQQVRAKWHWVIFRDTEMILPLLGLKVYELKIRLHFEKNAEKL